MADARRTGVLSIQHTMITCLVASRAQVKNPLGTFLVFLNIMDSAKFLLVFISVPVT
jgi:hypothetical protein